MQCRERVINQEHLVYVLRQLFLHEINTRQSSDIKYPDTQSYLELDVWIPSYKLCFEFQDPHHYKTTWYSQAPVGMRNSKQILVTKNKMDLITVPCWWDGSHQSLLESINFQRPDLFPSVGEDSPISLNPPYDYFYENEIPGVGELMLASFPKEVDTRKSISSNNPWWMGEKYDGIRFCWNSSLHTLGNEIIIPNQMKDQLPSIFVDGEIWFGRGQFSHIHSLIYESHNIIWPLLRVIVFDVPSLGERKVPFEKRYSLLLSHFSHDHSFSSIATRLMCQSVDELNNATQNILCFGGEGVVLRLFNSFYLPGRNLSLLKVKAARGDAEGIVVGLSNKKDVTLQMPSGETFDVPVYNVHVSRLKIGDVVTYSYERSAQRSVPVSPKIIRIRSDLSWDAVNLKKGDISALLDASSTKAVGYTAHAPNYWTAKKMRLFLENIAKSKKMDPLLPQTWYSITPGDICLHKGGKTILQSFKGGYYHALKSLFPELSSTLDIGKFHKLPLWSDIANRRKVFENYAKENKIDLNNATHWSSHVHLLSYNKSINSIITNYYNNSPEKALMDLFPDVHLNENLVPSSQRIFDIDSQRDIVESFAKQNNFSPYDPEQWKNLSKAKLFASKELGKIILYNNNSLSQTLQKLYPNIDTKSIFSSRSRIRNRRLIFEKYAKQQGFDPQNATEWYKQPIKLIASQENVKSVVKYYSGSVTKALTDLFSNINLDETKFTDHKARNFWAELQNRKRFFDEIAQENRFDPHIPKNWTTIQPSTILDRKHSGSVLRYHNGSIKKALVEIYSAM